MVSGDPNSSPHASAAGILSVGTSPQPFLLLLINKGLIISSLKELWDRFSLSGKMSEKEKMGNPEWPKADSEEALKRTPLLVVLGTELMALQVLGG